MIETNYDYINHWNEKFTSREWGKYPPEDLVRFIGRNYKKAKRDEIKILEVGCGPGANVWFLHRERYEVAGIDGSPVAIEFAKSRIEQENANINHKIPDLRVGNFIQLPWADNTFDVVIDIFAIYANLNEVIEKTLVEVRRVLKPGGRFYSKMWGTKTTGYNTGEKLEDHTFTNIAVGPCKGMGVSHFFDESEIYKKFKDFNVDAINKIQRTDCYSNSFIEELICEATKP